MAYNFITQYTSPNQTPASQTRATWGRDRKIEKIAIHWWTDPATNPTFEGIINGFMIPGGLSAHFVATGTGRRVACLVDPVHNSWATASANPYTVSIECDPRCRDEDYDVIGELVAELRATYGNLPLMKHSDVVATRCPGSYDLARIDRVAATKVARKEDQYGMAKNKTVTPTPAPTPTYKASKLDVPIEFVTKVDAKLIDIPKNTPTTTVLKKGSGFRAFASVAAHNTTFYLTEYSYGKGILNGVKITDLTNPTPPVTPPTPTISAKDLEQDKRLGDIEGFIKKVKDL